MLPADPTGTPTMPETAESLPFQKSFAVELTVVELTVSGMRKDGVKRRSLPSIEITLPIRTDDCRGYIDALPRIADALRGSRPVAVRIAGDVGLVRYAVDATYGGFAGDPFGDCVMAHDREEAEFLIRWTMTENQHFNFADDPAMFGRVMTQHRIHKTDVRPELYSECEIKTALAELVREARAGGHCGPALDLARTIAEAIGFDVEPVPAPGM
jgi:hypothetical protein